MTSGQFVLIRCKIYNMNTSISIAKALGHGLTDKRIEILRLIGKTGSISQAARNADVSYKAAWQAIDTLTNLAGVKLVEKVVGGVGGGGAILTEAGAQLLLTAELLESARQAVLDHLGAGAANVSGTTLSQLAIRTSMRNQLPCRVQNLDFQGQIVRVTLQLPGGEQIISRITRASAELLALETDQEVLALFKATAVEIGSAYEAIKNQGKNLLDGCAGRISRGEREDEISVELSAGLQLVGFSQASLSIKPRARVIAIVDESAVVIALGG